MACCHSSTSRPIEARDQRMAPQVSLPFVVHLIGLRLTELPCAGSNVQDEAKRKKMMMSEFAQFGASWWPYADFERMVTHLTLVLWVFVWDDTMDDETSEFFLDAEGASLARKEAIYVALECLGEHRIPASNKPPLGFIADSFRPIGEEIRKVSTPGQCKRIVADIRHFVEMTAHEQLHRLNTSALPSADTYWKFRQGTSAANICVSTIEASRGSQVPDHIMHDEDVLEVKRRTNEILSLTNDLLSLKKEIANGQFDNLIPLMAAESSSSYCDIQAGIDRSMEWLRESVNYFNAAASRISARADLADSGYQRELEEWVDGCKYFITGNISWRLVSNDGPRLRCADGILTALGRLDMACIRTATPRTSGMLSPSHCDILVVE